MAPTTTKTSTTEKPARKTKSGGGKKKLTPFNRYMQTEMQRLKEEEPELSHKERFKRATGNWRKAPENPKRAA